MLVMLPRPLHRFPLISSILLFICAVACGQMASLRSKLASFFLTVDRASIDNGAIINGTTLDPNTLSVINPYTQVCRIPQRRIRVSPRVDYELTPADTLSIRYAFSDVDIEHSGVGGFNLVSSGICRVR
jgi:hypothetical protein